MIHFVAENDDRRTANKVEPNNVNGPQSARDDEVEIYAERQPTIHFLFPLSSCFPLQGWRYYILAIIKDEFIIDTEETERAGHSENKRKDQ